VWSHLWSQYIFNIMCDHIFAHITCDQTWHHTCDHICDHMEKFLRVITVRDHTCDHNIFSLGSSSWWFLGPFTFSLRAFDFHEYPWVTKSTSLKCCCCWFGTISLSCADVALAARRMSTHFSNASLDSHNNFLHCHEHHTQFYHE